LDLEKEKGAIELQEMAGELQILTDNLQPAIHKEDKELRQSEKENEHQYIQLNDKNDIHQMKKQQTKEEHDAHSVDDDQRIIDRYNTTIVLSLR